MYIKVNTEQHQNLQSFDKVSKIPGKGIRKGPDGFLTGEDIAHLSDMELTRLSAVVDRSSIGKKDAESIKKAIAYIKALRGREFKELIRHMGTDMMQDF